MEARSEKMRKHVLFLTYHLPLPSEPGAFRPWMEARLMARAGYEVTVVTSGVQYMTGKDIRPGRGWCTEEMLENIRILRTWAPSNHRGSVFRRILNYVSYSALAGLAAILKVGQAHRIFAGTDPIFLVPVVYLISLIKRAPMILDERDLFPETAIALGVIKEGWLSHRLLGLQQFFRKKSSAIIAATPGILAQLINYGCPEGKVSLLYNADAYLDQELGNDDVVTNLRESTGKRFLVGYAGGLGRANDISTLIRAASLLLDLEDPGIVIIGSGERKKYYEEICRRENLTNVFLYESVPRREARLLIKQMDICVHLYPQDELFAGALASKIFDYLGVGKPVIFCGNGDTVNLLKTSRSGMTLRPEDHVSLAEAIKRLRGQNELRVALGRAGREWFEANVNDESASHILKQALESHGRH